MKNKIPTAEELLANNIDGLKEFINDDALFYFYKGVICEFAKNFAELHIQETLKQASENAFVEFVDLDTNEVFDYTDVIIDDGVAVNVNKDSILKSYKLDEIK